jgi:hypothetical protein
VYNIRIRIHSVMNICLVIITVCLKLFQAAVCYEPWHIVKQRLSTCVLLANLLLIETLFMYVCIGVFSNCGMRVRTFAVWPGFALGNQGRAWPCSFKAVS